MKRNYVLIAITLFILSFGVSSLSAQIENRGRSNFGAKWDSKNFKHFKPDGTGQQNMNAYLLSYLSSMVYTQNVAGTPSNVSSEEVTRLNEDQNAFEAEFIRKARRLFPLSQKVKMKWFHEAQPNGNVPGYFDPEAMAISTKDYIIIVFRGTDRVGNSSVFTSGGGEWIGTNFDFVPVPSDDLDGKVHRGFFESIKPIRRDLSHWIISQDPKKEKKIWLTGHSLGGAQAQLFAAHLIRRGRAPQGVFTFASPHVGDHAFVANLNSSIGGASRIQRFEFNMDPATQVPNMFYFARAGIRNYFENVNQYEHNVSERLIRTTAPSALLANVCYHYDGWYVNACYNLLTEAEKRLVVVPFELPTKDHYFGCSPLHVSIGDGSMEDVAARTFDQWKVYVEAGIAAGRSITEIVGEMYRVGELTIPQIVRIAKAASIGIPALATGISALGAGQLEIAIPAFVIVYGEVRVIAEALKELGMNENEILKHLANARVAYVELIEIGSDVWGMSVNNVSEVLETAMGVITPGLPPGLESNGPFYIKHVINKDVKEKDRDFLGSPNGGIDGAEIALYDSSSPNFEIFQKGWKIIPIKGYFPRYYIRLNHAPNLVLQVDNGDESNVHLWATGNSFSLNQQWEIAPVGDGRYTIKNVGFNERFLYVNNNGDVIANPNNSGKYKKHYWKFERQ